MAEFFYITLGSYKEHDLIDLFARRYGWGVETIEALDITTMRGLVDKILDANREARLFEQWVACYPFMAMKFIRDLSFEEFKDRSIITIDTRPAEDILEEVWEIREQMKET